MPATFEALFITAFFVFPGFVGLVAFRFFVVLQRRDTPRLVLDAIAGSMLFWTILAPVVSLAADNNWLEEHPVGTSLGASLAALVLPALVGMSIGKAIHSGRNLHFLPPKAWDSRFSEREAMLVRATLSDGSQLGGLWAGESCASVYPEEEDLYLECVFELDEQGVFVKPMPYSKGVWISGKSIRLLEFLRFDEGEGS